MMQFISCTINAHFVNFVPRARQTAGAYRLLARGINGRTKRDARVMPARDGVCQDGRRPKNNGLHAGFPETAMVY